MGQPGCVVAMDCRAGPTRNRVGWLPRRDDSAGTGALKTVLLVLLRQPHLVQHGATWPLDQLLAAIWDLKQGRVAPIFKPTKQKTGHPGTSNDHGRVMGMAARALSELIDGQVPPRDAATQVAAVVRNIPGFKKVTAAKVTNWRERIMQGPGPGAPQVAINYYRMSRQHKEWTPKQRGEGLIRALRKIA